jgi:hypothetical protein
VESSCTITAMMGRSASSSVLTNSLKPTVRRLVTHDREQYTIENSTHYTKARPYLAVSIC